MRRGPALLLAAALVGWPAPAGAAEGAGWVTVFEPGGLSEETMAIVRSVATRHGAAVAVRHTGTLGLLGVLRGDQVVQAAPEGFRIPMAALAVDPAAPDPRIEEGARAVLAAGEVVFGEASAGLRGAREGDLVELLGWDGRVHRVRVGAVIPDDEIGWAEVAFGLEAAAGFGFRRPSSMVLTGPVEELRADLEAALEDRAVGVRAAGDPLDPDRVLPNALLKRRFGEFAYRPRGGDRIEIDPAWVEANIVTLDLPVLGPFRCHRLMALPLEGAVMELVRSGFIHHVDPVDFQVAGGCWNPRMIRGGDKGGAISRHAWGAAIDINPSRNPYGGEVAMNHRIVETFRHWGFAWGGTWVSTDGGHFEWNHVPAFLIGKPSGIVLSPAVP